MKEMSKSFAHWHFYGKDSQERGIGMKKKIIVWMFSCLFLTVSGSTVSAAENLFGQKTISGDVEGQVEMAGEEAGQITEFEDVTGSESETSDSEDEGIKSEEPKPEKPKPEKMEPYTTKLSFDVLLYKGDTIWEGIHSEKGNTVTIVSSKPSVVKAGKNGSIKALKCGKAMVKTVLEKEGKREILTLHVHVKASSYAKIDSNGAGAKKIKQNSNTGLVAFRELAPGKTLQLTAWEKSGNAEITYKSSNGSVAKVDGKGKVTAVKNGSCTIQTILKNGKEKAVYRVVVIVKDPLTLSVTNAQKDQYFRGAVMVGNSLGVGLESYCRYQYAGFLGNARHFSSGSFSLMNDRRPISATSLHPRYQGTKYKVKDAIKQMGAKKAFLSFGMNDLNIYGINGTVNVYKQFIRELQQQNKGLKVYVVSMTPVRRTSGRLENRSIRQFNSLMKEYTKKASDVYFVDIFSPFLDGAGLLASNYCSDGFCHLTSAGYAVWTDQLKHFAGQQIAKEMKAKDAVATVRESRLKQDYQTAKKMVDQLEPGELQAGYLKRLQALKGKLVE